MPYLTVGLRTLANKNNFFPNAEKAAGDDESDPV